MPSNRGNLCTRELIGSYVRPSRLDAQFDFNLYFDAVNCFAYEDGSLINLAKSLDESLTYYGFPPPDG